MTAGRRRAIAASLFAAAFAILVFASGVDRYSTFVVSAARLVPEPFRVSAARSDALGALAREEVRQAEAEAALSVARDPMNGRSISILAASRSLGGDAAGAADALRVGALLGWRDVVTQVYWFRQNLDEGEVEAAAMRLDAILRSRVDMELVQVLLGELEASAKGRRALAHWLRQNPAWTDAYLSSLKNGEDALRARAAFLAAPDTGIAPLGCAAVEPMVAALARNNHRAEAEALAVRHCPALAAKGLIADPDFTAFGSGKGSQIGWVRHGAGDVRVTAGEGQIEIANRASVTRLVLSQPVALASGTYLLRGKVAGLNPQLLVATVSCGGASRPGSAAGVIAGGGQRLEARGCRDEVLSLWLRPGNGALTVSGLTLAPL